MPPHNLTEEERSQISKALGKKTGEYIPRYTYWVLKKGNFKYVYIYTRIKTKHGPGNGREGYLAASFRWNKSKEKYDCQKLVKRAKKRDAANLAAKWKYDTKYKEVENPPKFYPVYEKKRLSEETLEKLKKRGKRLSAFHNTECPRCSNPIYLSPRDKKDIIICSECESEIVLAEMT